MELTRLPIDFGRGAARAVYLLVSQDPCDRWRHELDSSPPPTFEPAFIERVDVGGRAGTPV